MKDGWIVKVLGERKTAFGTAWYQLNHSSFDKTKKRFHISTWFGVCSYRKLKVTPEKRKEICPICQHELKDIKYVGGACAIKHKDDPDYCRDSYENFLDMHGHVRWIEAPRLRKRGSYEIDNDYFQFPCKFDVVIDGHICKGIVGAVS